MVMRSSSSGAAGARADVSIESYGNSGLLSIADDHVFSATVTEEPHCSAIGALRQSIGYISMLQDR